MRTFVESGSGDELLAAPQPTDFLFEQRGDFVFGEIDLRCAPFGTMTNRMAVDKPLTVRSANGPGVTVIRGYQVPGSTNGDGAVCCVYLADAAALLGFTPMNGSQKETQKTS